MWRSSGRRREVGVGRSERSQSPRFGNGNLPAGLRKRQSIGRASKTTIYWPGFENGNLPAKLRKRQSPGRASKTAIYWPGFENGNLPAGLRKRQSPGRASKTAIYQPGPENRPGPENGIHGPKTVVWRLRFESAILPAGLWKLYFRKRQCAGRIRKRLRLRKL